MDVCSASVDLFLRSPSLSLHWDPLLSSSLPLMPVLAVLLLTLVLVCVWSPNKGSNRLPPGPKPFPFVGNLLQMKGIGFATFMERESEKYGPVITAWMGSRPIVCITSAELAHESFVKQGSEYTFKPRNKSAQLLSGNYSTVNCADGEYWKMIRAVLSRQVTSGAAFKLYSPSRSAQADVLLERLTFEAEANSGIVSVRTVIKSVVLQSVLDLCFGKKFDLDDPLISEMFSMLEKTLQLLAPRPSDYIPVLRMFSSQRKLVKAEKKIMECVRALFGPLLEECRQRAKDGARLSGKYVDTLLLLQATGEHPQLTDDAIMLLCREVCLAAVDTTANSLEWALANLITNSECQAKIAIELEKVAGSNKVQESDLERLPYLQAVVKESMRLNSPLPTTPVHVTGNDVELAGYKIPKGTQVVLHLRHIAHDPQIWKDPFSFKPERLLQSCGTGSSSTNDYFVDADMTGSRRVTFIPFGTGRRICPGINVAIVQVSLMLARMIQAFEFRGAAADQAVDLTEGSFFVNVMKTSLRAKIVKRS